MFSKSCEYAIRAALLIAAKSLKRERIGLKSIAAELSIPEPFLGKILQEISRKQIISSAKGPKGGFFLNEKQLNLPLIAIIEAIDGKAVFNSCILGLPECNHERPCPLHNQMVAYREELKAATVDKTIKTLAEELNQKIWRIES